MVYNLFYYRKEKQMNMKTTKLFKVALFLVLGLFLISYTSNAQDTKLSRKEKKELRKTQLNANFYALDTILNVRNFVLEADYLQDRNGVRIPVVSNVNFIKVNGSDGVLQTGTTTGRGYNGVGGVTASGSIGSWKIDKNAKTLSYIVSFSLMSNIGNYDIFMMVSADNHATATITGLGPGKLTWEGHLEAGYNSSVFKGQDSY
jgi:hypothetical protein